MCNDTHRWHVGLSGLDLAYIIETIDACKYDGN